MSHALKDRAVYVAGIGMHRYQFPSDTPYVSLGLTAIREAVADANIAWSDVGGAVVATAAIGMAAGRVMLKHMGSTGLEVEQVENASASGSTAFRLAALQVASGEHEVVLAMGVDKFGDGRRAANKDGLQTLSPTVNFPLIKFALMARRWMREYDVSASDLARVAAKNHSNAALNPYAQFRKPRTMEQVLASPLIAGDLTSLQCTPRGEGAAAVILMSEAAVKKYGVARANLVRVLSSVSVSEELRAEDDGIHSMPPMIEMVRHSTQMALERASIAPSDLDLIELHDAFSIEEIVYSEVMGICQVGAGADYLRRGHSAIGGLCAINASGGLIGMGHPLGPTGVGQIAEIVRQIRGQAQGRQHPGAKTGLAHMVGLGSVAVAHVLQAA